MHFHRLPEHPYNYAAGSYHICACRLHPDKSRLSILAACPEFQEFYLPVLDPLQICSGQNNAPARRQFHQQQNLDKQAQEQPR